MLFLSQRIINADYTIPEGISLSEPCKDLLSRLFKVKPEEVSPFSWFSPSLSSFLLNLSPPLHPSILTLFSSSLPPLIFWPLSSSSSQSCLSSLFPVLSDGVHLFPSSAPALLTLGSTSGSLLAFLSSYACRTKRSPPLTGLSL